MKAALVTGGSSGIGHATCLRLLASGFNVAFCGRSEKSVEGAISDFRSQFPSALVFGKAIDLGRLEQVDQFVAEARSALCDSPSVLIHNAGISPKHDGVKALVENVSPAEWEYVFAVNLTAGFRLAQLCLPSMKAAAFGRIVLIGSLAARATPKLAGAAYVASKAALTGLMRTLVSEVSGSGITTNIVAPGNVVSKMLRQADASLLETVAERIPSGFIGEPDDIATVIAFLCTEEARYVNGAVIDVNGGEWVSI
jgi:3-oxoacyl-[acyl-carrier protein] reductase